MSVNICPSPDLGSLTDLLLKALADAGLKASLRSADRADWLDASARVDYLPVDYSGAMIDYQLEYWSGNSQPTTDISLTLMHNYRPSALWPLSATIDSNGKWRIGSNGGAMLPPLFVSGMARKSTKSIVEGSLAFLRSVCESIGQDRIHGAEAYSDALGLSEWHERMMHAGAIPELRHDLFLDVSRPMTDIWTSFRKSCKTRIASGDKLWRVQIVRTADPGQWDEFRLLHHAVAGRATRSDESWRLQHDAIASGDAFFVCLRDDVGRMVGGGLFHVTPSEGLYAVAAYDRALFDKPLGHVVQFHAIQEMKRRGVRWYKLGACVYPTDTPSPSEKEMSISHFKQGFASHLFPRYLTRYELKPS
ncbi:MAG TPA: FemAB family protein [Xanthomonadaceae bacterium]|jgi:FemAB family protein|nr:FemAB family protein [Xanthomonadaceae bacterium]